MFALLISIVGALAGPTPDRPGTAMPDRHWDVLHLDLDLRLDPGERAVAGTVTHTVVPLGRPKGRLRLHQVGLEIEAITVDGATIDGWRAEAGHLDIPMPVGGGSREVAITYRATPELGLHFRGPPDDAIVEVWSQGQESDTRHWFPTWDYPNDKFSYAATLTVPSRYVALSNGVLQGREAAEPGWTRWRYALDGPLPAYLVAVAVGDYAVIPDRAGDVPLEYVVPSWASTELTHAALGETPAVMDFFGALLDTPFPWPVYRQVYVQRFLYGAMENTTLTLTEGSLLQPLDDPFAWFAEEVVAHELVHQWFGDLVTCDGWRELWLNESFASYYAALWQRERRGDASFAHKLRAWHERAYDDRRPLAPRPWSEPREQAGIHAIYARGAIALHGLRAMLGPDVFDEGIARYLRQHRGGLVETDDLRQALQDVSGTHLGWWFDAFVHSGAIPAWTTSWRWADGELTIELEQGQDAPPIEVPFTVEIGGAGPTVHRTAWTGPGTTRIAVKQPEPPQWVSIDPEGLLVATWTHTQSPEAWIAQLRHSEAPYARLVAMAELAKAKKGGPAVAALEGVLVEAGLPGAYRARAASTLGQIATPTAVEALVRALDASDPLIREAAAKALREVPRAPALARRLERVAQADERAPVRAAALIGLSHQDTDRALFVARRLLSDPGEPQGPWELRAAAQVVGEHGDEGDLVRLRAASRHGLSTDTRAVALDQLVALIERLDEGKKQERAREAAARRLEALVDDPDHRMRLTAIARLGAVGDAQSVAVLGALAARSTVPAIATAARDVAAKLRAARPTPADAPSSDTDLEAVRERLKQLEERLERLETWRY